MTTETTEKRPTTHEGILAWVNEVAELTQPDRVHWCTGSDEEWTELTDALVATGTFTRLDPEKKPNSFYAASDPTDVARVEDRTYICSVDEKDAGPTNNWMDPDEMKAIMTDLYRGCMRGRTMYVIPFVMGHLDAEHPMFGVEITDSAYVVASHARDGPHGHRRAAQDGGDRRRRSSPRCTPSACRSSRARHDVAWPCNDTKYIVQFPEERDDLVLRLRLRRQRAARQEVLRAAHRQRHGARRGLAGRAHADPQAHLARGRREVRRGRVPQRLRQDQPRHARADHPGLEGRDPRRRHRLDADRRRTAGSTRSTRSSASSASRRAPASTPTPTRCAPSPRATRCSPTSRSPTTATSGGRAWRTTPGPR